MNMTNYIQEGRFDLMFFIPNVREEKMIAFSDDISFERIINIPSRQIGKAKIVITSYSIHYTKLYDQLLMQQLSLDI